MNPAGGPRRVVWLALWPIGLAVGVGSLAIAHGTPGYGFAGTSLWTATAALTAGWALIAVGLIAWARRPASRFGLLLAAGGLGWFLLDWNNPGIGSALAFTIGLALSAVGAPLIAHAVLAYPSGRLSGWPDRAGLTAAYLGAVLVLGILPALFFDRASQGCGQCPRNLLLVRDAPDLFSGLNRVGVQLGLGWTLALIVLLALRLARSTPALVRLRTPVAAAATAYLGLVAWDFQHSLDRGTLGSDPTDRRLWLGQAAALLALAAGVAWSWLRGRRTRDAVARLVVELAGSPAPGGLRDVLAGTLGDPSLQLAYPLADGRRVDAQGRPLSLDGTVTPLVRGGRQVAFLAHRAGLLDDPGLAEEVAAASRLALEHERLQAELAAQLQDLRASRARIIATGDAERRRLERDLHDGAQQRLVSLSLSLRLARSKLGPAADPGQSSRIDQAEDELRVALGELRELAHGIFPAVLADEGLAAAVEALAEDATVPIRITALPEGRLKPVVETAAYVVVAEVVRHSSGSTVTIGATRRDGQLVVEIERDGDPPDDLIDLQDRVGALDGRLEVLHEPGGRVRIRAEVPCES
jgi:signal transduction histidine kinase